MGQLVQWFASLSLIRLEWALFACMIGVGR